MTSHKDFAVGRRVRMRGEKFRGDIVKIEGKYAWVRWTHGNMIEGYDDPTKERIEMLKPLKPKPPSPAKKVGARELVSRECLEYLGRFAVNSLPNVIAKLECIERLYLDDKETRYKLLPALRELRDFITDLGIPSDERKAK